MPDALTDDERELYLAIADSPRFFIEEILGERLDEQQREVCELFPHVRRMSVKSGHSCFAKGTPVLMFNGELRAVEDVRAGDIVMGDDSTPRRVLRLFRGREEMYRFTYRDGTQYTHNASHILCLVAMASHSGYRTGDVTEVSVRDLLRWPQEKRRHHAGFRAGVEFAAPQVHPIPPYILGLWLGDGSHTGPNFCSIDPEVVVELDSYAATLGCRLSRNGNGRNLWLAFKGQGYKNPFVALLKETGLYRNKHIPHAYMTGSREERLALLAGLIDTDGSLGEGGSYDFIQKRKPLAEQVVWLVRSLGGHAQLRPKYVSTVFKSGHRKAGTYWRVYISGGLEIPCRVARKRSSHQPSRCPTRYGIKRIEALGEGDYYGFQVDRNNRFLGGDFMVLRNCGKDFLAARLALWYHIVHFPSIVVTTGPTDRQVQNIVWGEIRAAYKGSRFPIGGRLMPAASELRSDHPKHYMIGFTSDDPGAYQGLHAPHVLIVVTEAQAVHPSLWPGIESLMTAVDAKLLLIGNAIYEPGSEFYSTFTDKASLYRCVTLDSERSSHCSREILREWAEVYGETSPYYQARVKGVFPTDVSDSLIPLGWIERAKARWEQTIKNLHNHHGPECCLGVDVARFGTDHTVFYHGFRNHYWADLDRQGQDLMETAGHIKRRTDDGIPSTQVRVDDTGLGGGVTDRLREQRCRVTAINFGSKAKDEEHFQNARTEMYFNLRERFRLGEIAIDPNDRELVRDLSVIKMKQLSNGQVKIEDKAEQKRKLGYSPDRADALALAALPQGLALDLETGSIPARGLLEFYQSMTEAKEKAEAKGGKREPVAARPASEIPGSDVLLGGRA